ncbi:MAG TPA: helix-turn-helix transcriptional regulator [Solirubrobacteraceae bacterium]|nr:helix-turn-helix transcriptional regulator [Solirubrobacteraceae bacterium]
MAENIGHERRRAGLSQSELARASGVKRETIARLEAAQQEPRLITLVGFSFALRVPLHVFLVGLPEPGETND